MQKVLTAEEMREVDRLTTEKYGVPSIILMENAAHTTARIITEKLGGSVDGKSVIVLCGKGNNGGDGAAIARILWTLGASCFVYLIGKVEDTKGDAKVNFEILKNIYKSNETNTSNENCLILFEDYQIVSTDIIQHKDSILIDGLFGTGLSKPIRGELNKFVEELNKLIKKFNILTLSLDLPSGLNADLGKQIDININADLTVTFTAPKFANILPPASNFNGELHIANIGSPQELINNCGSQTYLAEKEDVKNWLQQTKFSNDSYKNKRGHALLIVGSKDYTGAAVLAGNSAMSSGVGLVTVVTSESALQSVSSRVLPEIITQGLDETENGAINESAFKKIKQLSNNADVLAIGSGMSSEEETTRKLVLNVVENRTTPIVVDADGINSLSPFNIIVSGDLPLILTPHEGEFLKLLGTNDKDAIKDRVQAVKDFAVGHNVILVLKGERTLIADPTGKVVINPTGNSGLGKAGNGDNLTGIITGFIAQAIQAKADLFETVVAAVYLSGLAGDIAAEKFGKRAMQASDVCNCLTEAFSEIETNK